MDIHDDYDAISQCNKCGFCQVACPIFRSTGHESGVARGRLALMRGIIEDRIKWDRDLEDPLFTCLRCEACTTHCFGSVPTAELIVNARAQYLEQVGRKPVHQLLFDQLLPYPGRLHMAARAVALGKNSGVSKLANSIGLLRIFGRDFAKADNIIEKLPAQPLRAEIKPGEYAGEGETLNIGYFVGCGVDVIQQEAGKNTFTLLKKAAQTVTVLDNCCCGLPAWTYGDVDAAGKLALKNLEICGAQPLDVIVTDCSSCASFLKSYPRVLDKTVQWTGDLPVFKDMAEFLSQYAPPVNDSLSGAIITYHDPCHAVRGQGISGAGRELIKQIPNVEYREMKEADWCCGGAGSYALSHYDLSMKVLDRKMDNLADTGADILATSCPACMIQLAHGIRQKGLKIKVRHISELLV